MVKRKQISKKEALSTFEITQDIPVRLIAVDIHKALDIAMRFNVFSYDAYFHRNLADFNLLRTYRKFFLKKTKFYSVIV
tara:strand:- start:238 stop:474 length:237 start_codon:yes stop_codon:yes gene_type:complete